MELFELFISSTKGLNYGRLYFFYSYIFFSGSNVDTSQLIDVM